MIDLPLRYQPSSYVPMTGDIVQLEGKDKLEVVQSSYFSDTHGRYILHTNEDVRLLDNNNVRIVLTKDIRLAKAGDYVVSLTHKGPTTRTIGSIHKVLEYDKANRFSIKYVCSDNAPAYTRGGVESQFALLALEEPQSEPTFPCYMKFIGKRGDGPFVVWLTSKTEGVVVESSNRSKPVGTRSSIGSSWTCFTYPKHWQLLENYSVPVQDKGEDKLEIVDIWIKLANNACNIINKDQRYLSVREAGTSLSSDSIDELYMLAADFIEDNEITELPEGMVSALRNRMRSRSKHLEDVEDFLYQLQDLVPKTTIDPTTKWFNDNSGNSSLTKREVAPEFAIWHELVQAVTKVLIEYRDNDQESLLKPEGIHILHQMIDSFIEKHDIREIPYEALNILRFTRVQSDNYNIQDEYNYYVDALIEKVKTNQTQIQNKEQPMNKLDLRLLLSLMAAMSSTDQEEQKDATNSEYVAIVTKDNNYEGYVYIDSVEDAQKIMQLPENEGKKLHLFKYESTLAQKPRKVISVERV